VALNISLDASLRHYPLAISNAIMVKCDNVIINQSFICETSIHREDSDVKQCTSSRTYMISYWWLGLGLASFFNMI